jgi:hypothetical protein
MVVYEDESSSTEIVVVKRKHSKQKHENDSNFSLSKLLSWNCDDEFERKMIMYISGIAAVIVAIMIIKPEGFSFTGGSSPSSDFLSIPLINNEANSLWEGQYGMSGGASTTSTYPDYNRMPQSNFYTSFG